MYKYDFDQWLLRLTCDVEFEQRPSDQLIGRRSETKIQTSSALLQMSSFSSPYTSALSHRIVAPHRAGKARTAHD